MIDEITGVSTEGFVELKPKMYSFLVDENSAHKKEKGVNKNVVSTIRYNKYKDVLLHKKCLRHSMNRLQSKDDGIRAYETNKISLSCLMTKYISKTMDMMDQLLFIRVNYKTNNYLLRKAFCQAITILF